MNLKHLSQLHLGNKNCQSFNFYEGVAPVLEGVGLHLKKLVLEEFTEIDVDYIGSKCPQLQHLALSGILTYAPIGTYRNVVVVMDRISHFRVSRISLKLGLRQV